MAKEKQIKKGGKALLYDVSSGSIVRLRKSCPRCGPGVYLGKHSNRLSCGKCGYAEIERR
jgi:small subunit ribosomal protein S27Ae